MNTSPSIDTFVIGVLGSADDRAHLDTIAAAGGGTTQAFIVQKGQDVTTQFQAALDQIRGSALSCSYKIPVPSGGGTLDYSKVNVQVTVNGNTQTIYYAADESQCDPSKGGWHYDQDPAKGGTPTSIVLCKSTCDSLQNTTGAEMNIQLGCKTIVKGPA